MSTYLYLPKPCNKEDKSFYSLRAKKEATVPLIAQRPRPQRWSLQQTRGPGSGLSLKDGVLPEYQSKQERSAVLRQ
ncbi:hypothetical protein RRG08_039800 [Elysia crispata]|uniref:Uncharacterized protein n=1 Tax=Elysia crispata TaxID=231223 RepID=A0AAE1AT32_9GAST|nr:hypothetical protein RRG08_039800 [Elysia crispata]